MVEGYTDAIACYEAGIGNVVATLGTALTEHHVKTLTRFAKKIIYLFDGDAAGQKAAERAIQFIESDAIDLRCVVLPDGNDPMEFITAHGGDALRDRLDASEPLMEFVFRKLEERSDVSTPGGRTRALEEALRLIYPLRASYMIDSYYLKIADRVGLDVENVRSAAPRVFREVEREEAERERRAGARERYQASQALGRDRTPTAQVAPASREPYDEVPLDAYGVAPVPPAPEDDPWRTTGDVPASATGAGAAAPVVLTELERRSLTSERELLTLLTAHPDAFRAYAERIVDIDWVDPRHEAIAWAVLATPEGATPVEAMDAARAVCPEAATLVSSGRISSTSAHPTDVNIKFLLDTLELFTVRRRLRSAQGKLRQGSGLTREERRELTIQASQGAARMRELERELEGVADPFAEGLVPTGGSATSA